MKKANEQLKGRLDKELEQIHFTRKQEVLSKIYRPSWKQKIHQLWNKKITIPLIPVSTVFVLFIFAIGYLEIKPDETKSDSGVLVEIAGSRYWKDDVERMISQNEN